MGAHLVGCSSSDRDEEVVAGSTEPCPGGKIGFECLPGRRLQGNEPLLAKLAIADDQAILDQISALQSQRFGYPEPCRRQQPKEVVVREWADGAPWRQVQRRRHDRLNLLGFNYRRRWPRSFAPAEYACRRDFVLQILGVSEQAEVANGVEPGLGHVLRCRCVTPVVDPLDLSISVTDPFGESRVKAQQSLLFRKLPSQAPVQRHVSGNVGVQHGRSPGQGCAIFMSIGRSTLA